MELKGSKTEKNLWEAFAGESQARNKYTYFASKAKKEGYEQISAIFTETANNEKEHAKIWFKLLMENGEIPDTLTCLRWPPPVKTRSTPRCTRAWPPKRRRGLHPDRRAVHDGRRHRERARGALQGLGRHIEAGKVYARETEQVWQCRNCGYVYIGTHAPVKCPVCAHPQAYFELRSQNY